MIIKPKLPLNKFLKQMIIIPIRLNLMTLYFKSFKLEKIQTTKKRDPKTNQYKKIMTMKIKHKPEGKMV